MRDLKQYELYYLDFYFAAKTCLYDKSAYNLNFYDKKDLKKSWIFVRRKFLFLGIYNRSIFEQDDSTSILPRLRLLNGFSHK